MWVRWPTLGAMKTNQELLLEAINIAESAHYAQFDKAGEPYILHPLRVMFSFQPWEHELRQIAVLHDTIEDSDISIDKLSFIGFSIDVIDAVGLLTHPKGQPYEDYIRTLLHQDRCHDLARQVKRADINDNLSMERLIRLEQATIDRLTHKYSAALKLLDSF